MLPCFVFVWALTLFHTLGTMGTRPNPGTLLCCVYVSPMLQESGQEGLPRSWISRLHFCLDVGHLAFIASLCVCLSSRLVHKGLGLWV